MNRLAILSLLAGWTAASALALEIKLPEETARLVESPLPGYALATTHCYTCHSVDYIRTQPNNTRATWRASVVKMQQVFRASIPDEAIDPIAEYLAKTYGAERASQPKPASTPSSSAKKTN